jgi:inner membrane protein
MPSIFTHVAVPLALRLGLGGKVVPARLAACGAVGSMLPDLDVLGLRLGVPYVSDYGHRGFTHSLFFAAVLALVGACFYRRLRARFFAALLFLFAAVASHGLLDTLTNGGRGVELLWPWTSERYFAPVRPIEVSPLGVRGFFSPRAIEVLKSEVIWVWAPALAAGLALLAARRR